MATVILGIVDPHWNDHRPRSRKDADWWSTQYQKMQKVYELAEGVQWEGETCRAAAIVIGGDLFHQFKGKLITDNLRGNVASMLRESPVPIYAIAGNHDMEHNRLSDAMDHHPFGVLAKSGVFKTVHWPEYHVIGNDPEVLLVGKEYTPEGPKEWLDTLRYTGALKRRKAELGIQRCVCLTHCFWGPTDGVHYEAPVVGHQAVLGTGIDTMLYGDPHTDDGVFVLHDEDGQKFVTGPGALIRGTIAESDVEREPKIAVMGFNPDGTHKTVNVPIPHRPASEVFDFESHGRQKKQKEITEQFVEKMNTLKVDTQTPDTALEQAQTQGTPAEIVGRARKLIEGAVSV